jgi:ParB-like chromosome segregation protein Spo0J
MQSFRGFPPIEVYKVGNDYFILDGHHRASVARYLGNRFIEAYVTEWPVLST